MDLGQVTAYILALGGLITAAGTYVSSARKSQLETLTTVIKSQGEHIETLDTDLHSARERIRALERSNGLLRRELRRAGIDIPLEADL